MLPVRRAQAGRRANPYGSPGYTGIDYREHRECNSGVRLAHGDGWHHCYHRHTGEIDTSCGCCIAEFNYGPNIRGACPICESFPLRLRRPIPNNWILSEGSRADEIHAQLRESGVSTGQGVVTVVATTAKTEARLETSHTALGGKGRKVRKDNRLTQDDSTTACEEE